MTTRTLVTTYYGPGKGSNKPVVKITRGLHRDELVPNISRKMVQNAYGAVVAEAVDDETGELLLVCTYAIGARFAVIFEADVTNPVCVTDIPKSELPEEGLK